MLFLILFYWILLLIYREMDYDGIVLESWSRWAAYGILHDPDMRNMVNTTFCNAFPPSVSISFVKFLQRLSSVVM